MLNEEDIRRIIENLEKEVDTAIKIDKSKLRERYLTEADKNAHLAKSALESGEFFDFYYFKSLAQHCLDVANTSKASNYSVILLLLSLLLAIRLGFKMVEFSYYT
jgi:hypothetical protein